MKINKSDLITLIGFLCFLFGMLAIFLSFIGVHFSFLRFIENWGVFTAIAVKLFIAISGLILVFIAKTPTQED